MEVDSRRKRHVVDNQKLDIVPLLQIQRRSWELTVGQDHLTMNPCGLPVFPC